MGEDTSIDELLRAVATQDVALFRDTWRGLRRNPDGTVDDAKIKLRSEMWMHYPRGPLPQYLAVLLEVLCELDRVAFRDEILRLRRAKLHTSHKLTLEMMAQRLGDQPEDAPDLPVPLYVSDVLKGQADLIRTTVLEWCKAPGLDWQGLSRIDVIGENARSDYAGLYRIRRSSIVLVWAIPVKWTPMRWFHRLGAEHTFYHEMGHHHHGHVEGGSVKDQEDEADAFARQIMAKRHPVLRQFVRAVVRPIAVLAGIKNKKDI